MARDEKPETAEARIPTTAAAMVDLLNSRPHATPVLPDTLDDPETAAAILEPFGRLDPSAGPQQLDRVRALRSDLMAVVAAPTQAEVEQGWTDLTEHTATVTLQQAFTGHGEARRLQVSGDPLVGSISLAVADLIADNTWPRIRACGNGLCSHVFYDTTRSRTQRWHSYETCGNRVNVAAHRARKGTSHPAG